MLRGHFTAVTAETSALQRLPSAVGFSVAKAWKTEVAEENMGEKIVRNWSAMAAVQLPVVSAAGWP